MKKIWVHLVKEGGKWNVYSSEEFNRRYRQKDNYGYSLDIENWLPCKVELPDDLDNFEDGEGSFVVDENFRIYYSKTGNSFDLIKLEEV